MLDSSTAQFVTSAPSKTLVPNLPSNSTNLLHLLHSLSANQLDGTGNGHEPGRNNISHFSMIQLFQDTVHKL